MKTKVWIAILFMGIAPVSRAAFINEAAPAFTLSDLSGQQTSLKDLKGKVVFVNFWASWCPPCKQEFPELNELANEYEGHKVRVLAINLDKKKQRVDDFLAKMKVTPHALTILLDPGAGVVADYVARSMPSSFIIDQKGIIRFVHFGYSEKDPAKWRSEINQLLEMKP